MTDSSDRPEEGGPSEIAGNSFSVNYVKSEEYEIAPITGVRGGAQPSGGLKFDFLLDYNAVPEHDKYVFDDEEIASTERIGGEDIERILQFGIFTSTEIAEQLGLFILSHAIGVDIEDLAIGIDEKFEEFDYPQEEMNDESEL